MKSTTRARAISSACDVHSEMGLLIAVIAIIIAILVLRRLTRSRRQRRIVTKDARRTLRYYNNTTRTGRKSGSIAPAARCPECGDPVAICRTRTRDAEHAEGMIGSR